MNRAFIFALALAACGTNNDVTGPFTGKTQRFVVDHFTIPTTRTAELEIADDLNGDDIPDNALGAIIVSLAEDKDVTPFSDDMIASGVIASTVEIQSKDPMDDLTAGVRYLGTADATATEMAGTFAGSGFTSNRTSLSDSLGAATIVLPVFIDADPSTLQLAHAEIDLMADGQGGYNARVRGLVDVFAAKHVAAVGLAQMIMSNPKDHEAAQYFFNMNKDDRVTVDEVETSELLSNLLSPDVTRANAKWLSVAFEVHLTPCEAGTCMPSPPVDACHDRLRDGDETGVDCGGTACMPCGEGGTCVTGSDCTSAACDNGTCRDWSCHDGVHDGFEVNVDCGFNCGGCKGESCDHGTDCASGMCSPVDHICQ